MADYLAVLLAEMIAIYFSEENLRLIDLFIVIPFIYIAFIAAARTYRRTIPFWQRIESLFYSSIYSIIAILLFFFVRASSTEHSIAFLALLWLASFICLVIMRYILKRILDESEMFKIPLLIIGAQEEALAFTRSINNDIGMSSYKIVGLISDKIPVKGLGNYPLLGDFKDIEEIIKTTGINNVLIAIPYLEQAEMQDIIHRVQPLVKNICIIPNLTAIPMGGIDVETFFTEKIMLIRVRNNLERRFNRIIKCLRITYYSDKKNLEKTLEENLRRITEALEREEQLPIEILEHLKEKGVSDVQLPKFPKRFIIRLLELERENSDIVKKAVEVIENTLEKEQVISTEMDFVEIINMLNRQEEERKEEEEIKKEVEENENQIEAN